MFYFVWKVRRLFATFFSTRAFYPPVVNMYPARRPRVMRASQSLVHWAYCKNEGKRARTKPNRPRLYIAFDSRSCLTLPSSPWFYNRYPVQADTAFYPSRVGRLEGRPDDFIGCDIPTLWDPRSFAPSLLFGQKRASNGCNIRLYWLLELGRPSCAHGVVLSSALC